MNGGVVTPAVTTQSSVIRRTGVKSVPKNLPGNVPGMPTVKEWIACRTLRKVCTRMNLC